ncbi:MAG: hypothetical protein Q7S12_00940 [bacterium]|nr:hypothetical protein [bacterium]
MFENISWGYAALVVVVFLVVKIWWENHKPRANFSFGEFVRASISTGGAEEDDSDQEILNLIRNAHDKNELLDIANDNDFYGKENDEFLAKTFQYDLSKYDWVMVYHSAASGSKLEELAEERAGRAL